MFLRIFLYKFRQISRNRVLVGWNFLFPLVLSTAFYLGFGNLIKDDPDTFKTIEAGYVNVDQSNTTFKEVLEGLAEETDAHGKIISLHNYSSKEDATKAMNNGDIAGFYVEEGYDVDTVVPANGYESTTLNQIVREYDNGKTTIENIAKDHPENMQNAINMMYENFGILKQHDFGKNTSQYLQYFFALIAMASLFSSWISTNILQGMCANLSEEGKQFECSPTSKMMAITAGILAGLVMQALANAIVIIYIQKVLTINMGAPLWNLILLSTIGSGLGISSGVLIGSIFKNKQLLFAIPLCFSMTCSFFSGLMWGQIKQIIQYHCPIMNKINPAALLTDSMYVRATYGATSAYYEDITIMLCMIAGCLIISTFLLRRRKYVSI